MRKNKKKNSLKRIPNSLRKYRRARGLKQKDVAEILGLKSTSIISRWERGFVLPKPGNIFKLATLYRTMTDALFMDLLRSVKEDIHEKEEEILKAKSKDEQQ
ncbi:MAG: helix-turn-helix transcriptional regulator [Candidatus Aerophobetes bacterium]|nr:helix-turn-helix transcriptional regulator [Candidatus Aerophobetes bacterium]